MKNYLLIALLFINSFTVLAQERKETREKIKALKIAYVTEQLNLTTKEAQQFWPLYNKHEEVLELLRTKGRSEIKNKLKDSEDLNILNEETSKKIVLLKLELDKEIVAEKENFVKKTATFLSYKKIMKLQISEREFARKLMRKYSRGKKQNK